MYAGGGFRGPMRLREALVQSLDRFGPRGEHRNAGVPSHAWAWPSAFALVVGALDRLAGPAPRAQLFGG